jgi:hypothetical protein
MANLRPEQLDVTTGTSDNDTVSTKGYVDDQASGPPFDNIDISGNTISSTSGDVIVDATANVSLRSNTSEIMTSSGVYPKYPNLPLFAAYRANYASSVTGDGTVYKGSYNATTHNQGNHYNTTTFDFTAPINGLYLFVVNLQLVSVGSFISAQDQGYVYLVVNTTDYVLDRFNPYGAADNQQVYSRSYTHLVELSNTDTVSTEIRVAGGSLDVDFDGDGSGIVNRFCGFLISAI